MAIERYSGVTAQVLKELIDSFDWFAVSEDKPLAHSIDFYADSEKTKKVLKINYGSDITLYFSHNGDADRYYIDEEMYGSSLFVYKTRNGLLVSSTTSYASSGWAEDTILIGKTNSGAVCTAMQAARAQPYSIKTSAYGEASNALSPFQFRYSADTAYTSTSQIAACPIPTCPSSGTSYIKNAVCLMTSPWNYYWGEVDIGGVRYATNGYLALNDED